MPRPILQRTRRNSRSLTIPERNARFLQKLSEAYDNYLLPVLEINSDDLQSFLVSKNIFLTPNEQEKLIKCKTKIIADKVLFREYLDYIKNNIDINTGLHSEYNGTELYNELMNPKSTQKKNPYFLATEIWKLMNFVQNKKRYADVRRREAERREARSMTNSTTSRPMTLPRGGSRKRRHRNSRSKRRHRTSRSKR